MWILFLVLMTSPGHFEVQVLETYAPVNQDAQAVCKSEAKRLFGEFEKSYPSTTDKDTFAFMCLKQKETTT